MQSVIGDHFITKDGRAVSFAEVEDKPVVALYFTASWCPPCKNFSPVLADFYSEVNFPDRQLEIIHVSSDRDEISFQTYLSELPWIAIPFGDPRIVELKQRFKITGIPVLMLINRDGSLAHGAARSDVMTEGPVCFSRWKSIVS
mmetsp:Transcript_971/g.2375  ORF Transcript_971/g.2375 Transcript_971/m.2375 type:complete len:144 (-) Transcript_971:2157-2588(-)